MGVVEIKISKRSPDVEHLVFWLFRRDVSTNLGSIAWIGEPMPIRLLGR